MNSAKGSTPRRDIEFSKMKLIKKGLVDTK